MKRFTKYILRGILALAVALVLSISGGEILLPVNIVTLSASVFMGVPGIALSIMLCNFIF